MSLNRATPIKIWRDPEFYNASDICVRVYFTVTTGPMSTPFGLVEATPEMLASQTRRPTEAFWEGFEEALAKGFFKYDPAAQLIYIPGYIGRFGLQSPNVVKSYLKQIEELHESPLVVECIQELRDLLQGYGKAFRKAFEEAFGKASGIRKQITHNTRSLTSSLRSEVSAEVETEPGSTSAPPADVAPETTVEATVERLRNAERLPDALRDVVVTAPEPPDSRRPENAATAPEREPPLRQAVALLPVVGPPHERVDARGYYLVCTEQYGKWQNWYPELDLRRELERMASWLEANPRRRKTARGIPTFVRNWLDREADNPRGRRAVTSGTDPETQAKREREEAADMAASKAQAAAELAEHWREKLAKGQGGAVPRNGDANGMRSMQAVLESLERQAAGRLGDARASGPG